MEYSPKDTIKLHMEQKTNEELLDIWVKNDRNEYSPKAFDVIHNILLDERWVSIPMQTEFIETKEETNEMTLGEFFSFKFMISPKLIQIIYILGAVAITVGSLVFMRERFWIGILSIIVGNLVWRLVCETAIIFFKMNEQLAMIHEDLKRSIK